MTFMFGVWFEWTVRVLDAHGVPTEVYLRLDGVQ